jgi:hypothetical protein
MRASRRSSTARKASLKLSCEAKAVREAGASNA